MLKIKDGYLLHKIADAFVVVPSGEELDLNTMITLNETGSFLWERLENGAEVETLTAALLEEYDVEADRAKKSVEAFLEKLKDNDLLA